MDLYLSPEELEFVSVVLLSKINDWESALDNEDYLGYTVEEVQDTIEVARDIYNRVKSVV